MGNVRTVWRVEGMHCPRCDDAVLRALRGVGGLSKVSVSYKTGRLEADWDSEKLPEARLRELVAEAGYQLKPRGAAEPLPLRLLRALGLAAALALLFLLFARTPVKALLSAFPTARAGMSLFALFTLGLLTSLHCVAMCGGINLMQSAGAAQSGGMVTAANLQYNLGRVISYTVIGGLAGALGSVLRFGTAVQAAIQLLAAAAMLLMALNLLDFSFLRGAVPSLPGGLRTRLLSRGGGSSLWIGLANGLMPCGPLQAMQLYALSAGSWQMGALSMLLFSLGTVPLMLGFGLVSGSLNKHFARPMRIASGALVLVMGMSMLTNGLSLAGVNLAGAGSGTAAEVAEDAQVVRSELDWRGYPDITVRAGVPVKWIISADAEKITGCNNEMVIPALGLRVPLNPGENVVEFTAEETGVIPYTCWMGMLHGSITVE